MWLRGAKQIQIRADTIPGDTLGTEMGGAGSGDEERIPQKQKTGSRACCLGFAELFAWRKTCILAGVCFPASFLKQSLLPRGREKTSQEGTPRIPRDPVSRFLLGSVNKHGMCEGVS